VQLPETMVNAEVLLSNYPDVVVQADLQLQPYQSVALLLN